MRALIIGPLSALVALPSSAAGLSIDIGGGGLAASPDSVATGLQIMLLLTVLSVAPSILLMTTSFVRFVIVFAMLRQALGIGQLPPTQVLIGLSLILTFLVMQPTLTQINDEALQPFVKHQMGQKEFFKKASDPLRAFMLKQIKEKDLKSALSLASIDEVGSVDEIPFHLVVVAFMLNELRVAFQIGFTLFLPFVIIDMIAASALVSVGLMFLPPSTISLPFKIILFVLIDGWNILSEGLVLSFNS